MNTWLVLLVLVLFVLSIQTYRSQYTVPDYCNPTPIDATQACSTVYPEFPVVGDVIENGTKKYCCKKF